LDNEVDNEDPVARLASLEIQKKNVHFRRNISQFSHTTSREQLHGHNYYVSLSFEKMIATMDYHSIIVFYKRKPSLCEQLDRHFLLAGSSPYLKAGRQGRYWIAHLTTKKTAFS